MKTQKTRSLFSAISLLLAVTLLSEFSVAAEDKVSEAPCPTPPAPISSGRYFTETYGFCPFEFVRDQGDNSLFVTPFSTASISCSDSEVRHFMKTSEFNYEEARFYPVTQKKIAACLPAHKGAKKPCDAGFYDPKTGELLVRIGDTIGWLSRIRVLDRNHVMIEAFTQWRRGSEVLLSSPYYSSSNSRIYHR